MSTTAESQPSSVPLDAARLQPILDGEHAAVRARVRELMSRPEFAPGEMSLPKDEYRERVLAWAKAVADAGETNLGLPEEFGGQGNVGGTVAAFETLAHGDLSLLVKFGVQFGLFGGAVLHLGTRTHHERYLRAIFSLELPGCFAMTETGHGSDVQSVGTTATYDPGTREFVIHTPNDAARKDYIGNAAVHGQMAAVFAQVVVGGESHGVHCLLAPLRDRKGNPVDGVRIEDCGEKLGLNGVDNGRIWFDNVRVPREALLNRYADVSPEGEYSSSIENPNARFFTMLGTLVQGRVSVGGAGISGAKSALTIAIRYALRRRQFGPPGGDEETLLLDYRMHQRRLLPLLARTYAFHFAQEQLVAEFHKAFTQDDYPERDRRKLESMAAGLKSMATWHATETIQTCREACGGAGYLYVNRFATLKADTDVFTTFEGDNTVLLQLVAKSLLTDYKDQFGELDPLGMVGFVAGQVIETIVERTAARELIGRLVDDLVPGRDEEADLLDRQYHVMLFSWREEHVLTSAARRLKRGIDSGMDPFDVFRDVQDHVYTLARVHVERLILDAFVAAIERCEDEELRPVLERLCSVYVLEEIQRDRGWFQEHGRISSTRAKAVTKTLNTLVEELRPDAGALVDAFGIPDAVLAAPIGLREESVGEQVSGSP
jgi:acyl-CoA oxidase